MTGEAAEKPHEVSFNRAAWSLPARGRRLGVLPTIISAMSVAVVSTGVAMAPRLAKRVRRRCRTGWDFSSLWEIYKIAVALRR